MAFNLENRNKEVDETPETQIDNESLAETEESSEDFDSCELREVDDRSSNEVNSKTLEETDDDFEDCESKFEQAEDESAEADEGDSDDWQCVQTLGEPNKYNFLTSPISSVFSDFVFSSFSKHYCLGQFM